VAREEETNGERQRRAGQREQRREEKRRDADGSGMRAGEEEKENLRRERVGKLG
jgi:hypothetical protein